MNLDRAVSTEAKLAQEFLATLESPRAPWDARFATWAAKRGLPAAQAREVRVTVLRFRMFGTVPARPGRRRGGRP